MRHIAKNGGGPIHIFTERCLQPLRFFGRSRKKRRVMIMDRFEETRFLRQKAQQLREIATFRRRAFPLSLMAVAEELDRRADDIESGA